MYAIKLKDGCVQQVIVGSSSWAVDNIGGEWIDSDVVVGIGWMWDGQSFVCPEPVETV